MYSPLTKSDINIAVPFIDRRNADYRRFNKYSCRCVINYTGNIYSLSDGTVIEVTDTYLTIQHSGALCLRYISNGFRHINVSLMDNVKSGDLIAEAGYQISIEAYTNTPANISWVVRLGELTLYKNDPKPYLDGSISLTGSGIYDATVYQIDSDENMPVMNVPSEFNTQINQVIDSWLDSQIPT